MIINHNMASLNTYRQLSANNAASGKSLEKLSSGLRINRAGDDAAGLAISEKMRGQIRGLDQAARNAQDSISLIQTAEGALSETHSILQRMRELAVQSSNDTNTVVDRKEIQKEVDQLKSEIDRIGNTTEFNTKNLLNGNVGAKLNSSVDGLKGVSTTADTKTGVYSAAVTTVAEQAKITAGDFTAGTAGTLAVNGTNISIATTDSIGDVVAKINNETKSTGVTAIIQEGSDATHQKIVFQSVDYGSNETVSLQTSSTGLATALGLTGQNVTAAGKDVQGTIESDPATGSGLTLTSDGTSSKGLEIEAVTKNEAATLSSGAWTNPTADRTLSINGKQFTITTGTTMDNAIIALNAATKDTGVIAEKVDATHFKLTTVATGANAKLSVTGSNAEIGFNGASSDTGTDNLTTVSGNITVNKDNILKTHIGANEGQNMDIDINDMRAKALGVDNLDLTTQSGANSAITTIQKAIETVSAERSKLGAFQNRLEHTIANLGTSSENLTAAESRVRDVDMAKEMMNFQKNNILSQAAQAMLAQANQQPQGVLQLLR